MKPEARCHNAHPAWSAWALEHLPNGLLVIDEQSCVVFANQWFLKHAQLAAEDIFQQPIFDVFPQLADKHFGFFLKQAIANGFPVVLSQTLHPAPFPLYAPGIQRTQDKYLRQSIRIIPVSGDAALSMGKSYTLIHINDVTQSVMRERLLKAQADKLKGLAHMDVLTGLGNRRLLDESLPRAVQTAKKLGQPLSVIMFDIDFFKQFNDTYGHLEGDACLRRISKVLRDVCQRPQDVVARFGGEELVAVLPETDRPNAVRLAELVLQLVREQAIVHAQSEADAWVTLSAGVSTLDAGVATTPNDLIDQADRALYAAKHQGRDRVCVAWNMPAA